MITICFTYFKSLGLANLDAALHSVRQQDFRKVLELVIVDNDTSDPENDILDVIDSYCFPVPVYLLSSKHGDASRTHSWSSNVAVREAKTPWVLFTRADYLLRFDAVKLFVDMICSRPSDWNGFVTSNGCHLGIDVGVCDKTQWRELGPGVIQLEYGGQTFDYTLIDAGVWATRRASFDGVDGLDESLTAWGHAQTHFQHKLYASGVEFVRIPETLFYHPQHAAPRDIDLAHRQLKEKGADINDMWARYQGQQPYKGVA